MTYIYLDESGDLGFGQKGSKYFVISCVKINDEATHNCFRRIPKKVRAKLFRKKQKKCSELKFSNSSDFVRRQFLEMAAKLPVEIFVLAINKRHTKKELQENLPVLYNYLIKIILEKAIFELDKKQELFICLDKCMSSKQRENFELYVKTEFFSLFKEVPKLSIAHEASAHNECLQVVDFICGAFGYKYNTACLSADCDVYVKIVQQRIRVEKNDLFREKANRIY